MSTYIFRDRKFKKYTSDEPREGAVEVSVDWERLVNALGTKAAFNRSRKSALAVGIKVTFFPRRP